MVCRVQLWTSVPHVVQVLLILDRCYVFELRFVIILERCSTCGFDLDNAVLQPGFSAAGFHCCLALTPH